MKRILSEGEPAAEAIEEIARTLEDGGVVLLPTDTIYGLHAVASNASAVARIAAIKGREDGKPFIVLFASVDQLLRHGAAVPEVLRAIWPAPLTAIVPHSSGRSLAVRVPDLAWLRELLERTGPLVSTSANRSGEPAVREPGQLAHELQDRVDSALEAGPRDAKPSLLVDFTGDEPQILREGDTTFTQFLRKTLRKTL
jgi:L-threonylcarbamoyladenylate synthase